LRVIDHVAPDGTRLLTGVVRAPVHLIAYVLVGTRLIPGNRHSISGLIAALLPLTRMR